MSTHNELNSLIEISQCKTPFDFSNWLTKNKPEKKFDYSSISSAFYNLANTLNNSNSTAPKKALPFNAVNIRETNNTKEELHALIIKSQCSSGWEFQKWLEANEPEKKFDYGVISTAYYDLRDKLKSFAPAPKTDDIKEELYALMIESQCRTGWEFQKWLMANEPEKKFDYSVISTAYYNLKDIVSSFVPAPKKDFTKVELHLLIKKSQCRTVWEFQKWLEKNEPTKKFDYGTISIAYDDLKDVVKSFPAPKKEELKDHLHYSRQTNVQDSEAEDALLNRFMDMHRSLLQGVDPNESEIGTKDLTQNNSTITLFNGTKVARSVVIQTVQHLKIVKKDSYIAFSYLVKKCRGENSFECSEENLTILRRWELLKDNGVLHTDVKNIVLCAVIGDDPNMEVYLPY